MHRQTIKQVALQLLFVIGCFAASNDDLVEFTVVDRIHFAVPGGWAVIASKSTPERTVFAFQIPNPANSGTSDSTNLSIISTFLRRDEDKETFNKKQSSQEHNAQEKKIADGWICSSFSAAQGTTPYVVWDCYRIIGNSGVSVRLAWPHLPKRPANYDREMETVLSDFLTRVTPFKEVPTPGVLRREKN